MVKTSVKIEDFEALKEDLESLERRGYILLPSPNAQEQAPVAQGPNKERVEVRKDKWTVCMRCGDNWAKTLHKGKQYCFKCLERELQR